MTEFLFVIVSVAFFSYGGYMAAGKSRRRKLFFQAWYGFHVRFLEEVSYRRRPLGECLLQGFAPFDKLLRQEPFRPPHYLTAEEAAELNEYLAEIGTTDAATQRKYLEAKSQSLQNLRDKSQAEYRQKKDLGLRLGSLLGLAVAILMI